jgi:hypothetical protein
MKRAQLYYSLSITHFVHFLQREGENGFPHAGLKARVPKAWIDDLGN